MTSEAPTRVVSAFFPATLLLSQHQLRTNQSAFQLRLAAPASGLMTLSAVAHDDSILKPMDKDPWLVAAMRRERAAEWLMVTEM